jgi:hypothetical protein
MPAYLTKSEEKEVRCLLDEMAAEHHLHTDRKESFFKGFYVDRVWRTSVESIQVPVVGFEIERSVPTNERFRKDILNLAMTRAPLGFIVLPHTRVLKAAKGGSNWETWYRDHARGTLEVYSRPFEPYISIQILDVDKLLRTRSLDEARDILWTRRLTRHPPTVSN